jgi:hypothetical protein
VSHLWIQSHLKFKAVNKFFFHISNKVLKRAKKIYLMKRAIKGGRKREEIGLCRRTFGYVHNKRRIKLLTKWAVTMCVLLTTRLKLFCLTYLLSINFLPLYLMFLLPHMALKNIRWYQYFSCLNVIIAAQWCVQDLKETVNGEKPACELCMQVLPCNLLVATLNITVNFSFEGETH